jgi:hypothetical protein
MDVNEALLTETDSTAVDPNKEIVLTANSFPSKVCLIFLGKSRPLQGKRQMLVQYWQKMLKISDDLTNVFGTEMLFREGDKEFWIAIQKPLVDPLPREAEIGKSFTAYVIWMGAIKSEGHWEWVFAMNEFDAPPDGGPTQKGK